MLDKILRIEDLMEISNFITERRYDVKGLSINMSVDSDTLQKINEDYLYRYSMEKVPNMDSSITEMNVNIGGVAFKYFVDKKEN